MSTTELHTCDTVSVLPNRNWRERTTVRFVAGEALTVKLLRGSTRKLLQMPMLRDEKTKTMQRLFTTHGKTREVLKNERAVRELHPGTKIASNWTVMTASYSRLEQTSKFLTVDERGLTASELIAFCDGNLPVSLMDCFFEIVEPNNMRKYY